MPEFDAAFDPGTGETSIGTAGTYGVALVAEKELERSTAELARLAR